MLWTILWAGFGAVLTHYRARWSSTIAKSHASSYIRHVLLMESSYQKKKRYYDNTHRYNMILNTGA